MTSPASPASAALRGDRGGAAAPPLRIPRPAGGTPGAQPRRAPGASAGHADAVGDGPVLFVTPYLVQASCELSEDYFLTSQVLMNTGDVVRPFARADGTVEALVVSGGVLSHLSRSATETSGWSYTALPGTDEAPMTGIVDVAVNTGPDGTVWALALRVLDSLYYYTWAVLGSSGAWEYPGQLPITADLDKLQSGLDPAGNVYFYAFFTSSTSSAHRNGSFALWQPHVSFLGTFNASLAGLDITDARLLWNPGYSASSQAGGIIILTSKNVAEWHQQTSATEFQVSATYTLGSGVAALLWASWSANPIYTQPSSVLQHGDGTVFYTDQQAYDVALTVFVSVGADQVAVWFKDDLASFAMLTGGTLNILAQYGDPAVSPVQFTPPIPVAGNILAVSGLPTDPDQATLFVTYDDATLHVLTKSPVVDAATGVTADAWTNVPVQQPSAALQELSTWRVQVSVQDANGTKVSGAGVTITGDREIGVWQASGSTFIGPAAPVTLTTDARGNVTFAVPAVELDTAVLTVQALDSTGAPSGPPFTVHPDTDVHQFLAGNAPLADIGPLTGAAMVAATNPGYNNSPVFPVLAGLPAASQASGSAAMASALNHMMQAGLGSQPGPNDPKSVQLDMTGAAPTFQTSPDPAAFTMLASSDWWDKAKNDAESAYHGLRHGVIKMEKATTQWVQKESSDAFHWVVSLAVTIGDDIADVMTIAIDDIKSAIHAVSSFFQALGADIEAGLNWLKHNILALIKEAGQNAKVIEGFLGQLPAKASAQLTAYENLADGYFAALKTQAHAAIQKLASQMETAAFGTSAPIPPPTTDTGSNDAVIAAGDIATFMSHVSHNWLLDKIMSWFEGDSDLAANPAVSAVVKDLITALTDAEDLVKDMTTLVWDGCSVLFANRDAYNVATFGQLFAVFDSVIDDLLSLADAIVDLVLDLVKAIMDALAGALAHEIELIPLLGALLELCGIDTSMSVGHLVSLILMYPATLYNDIKHKGTPLFPPPAITATPSAAAAAGDDWFNGLNTAAAVAQVLWGGADAYADTYRPGGKEEPPNFLSWVDIIAPFVISILQWPGATRTDGTTPPPFTTEIPYTAPVDALTPITWLLGLAPPTALLSAKIYASGRDIEPGDAAQIQDMVSAVVMSTAIAATGTGTGYNFDTDADQQLKAGTILGNVSNIISSFSTEDLAEATEGISVVIKLMIDLIGNIGAGVCIGSYSENGP